MRAILPSNLPIGSVSVRHRQFATTGFPKDALPDSHVFLEKDDGAPAFSRLGACRKDAVRDDGSDVSARRRRFHMTELS
jgi:hypothetical protein